jgi:putative oxygen-independent coproporphyrinogen III oxidase
LSGGIEISDTERFARRPFGVYVHWPYCAAKCPYCDFNSYVSGSAVQAAGGGRAGRGRRCGFDEARYLAAVLRELDHAAALAPGREVETVFFGGGTPSLMAEATVDAIIERIAFLWPVNAGAEITIEANPSSSEAGRFAGYRAAGVNRLSLGVQSLDDSALRFLGRLHDAAEARLAVRAAQRCFPRVSFDMIYARPGQTCAQWRQELSEAVAMAQGHLSVYQLTIEQGTAFFARRRAGRLSEARAETAVELYELTQELCEAAGLSAYEVSNHASPGEECRHNLLYWRYGEYAGVGPGAHSRLNSGPLGAENRRIAIAAHRDPEVWMARVETCGHGFEALEELTPLEEAEERLIMGLRLNEGVDLGAMEASTGLRLDFHVLRALRDEGFIERPLDGARVRATPKGRLLLDALIQTLAETLRKR